MRFFEDRIMFEITFNPRIQKVQKLPKDKMEKLHMVIFSIVTSVFQNQGSGSTSSFTSMGVVTIKMKGIAPFSNRDTQEYVQRISDLLSFAKLDSLFLISSVSTGIEPFDHILSPDSVAKFNLPMLMIEAFDLSEKPIPDEFICPIGKEVMWDPAYLASNPKINYEYSFLMKWVVEHNSDPVTRTTISAPGITNNYDLKKRIYSFVIDMIFERDLTHYFNQKKDTSTQRISSNSSAIFCEKQTGTDSVSVANVFKFCKLENEFYALGAKALRRAVHENSRESVESLFSEFGSENIINLQDDNPASKKTALHIAITRNHPELTTLLLDHHAKTDISDASGITAAQLIFQRAAEERNSTSSSRQGKPNTLQQNPSRFFPVAANSNPPNHQQPTSTMSALQKSMSSMD